MHRALRFHRSNRCNSVDYAVLINSGTIRPVESVAKRQARLFRSNRKIDISFRDAGPHLVFPPARGCTCCKPARRFSSTAEDRRARSTAVISCMRRNSVGPQPPANIHAPPHHAGVCARRIQQDSIERRQRHRRGRSRVSNHASPAVCSMFPERSRFSSRTLRCGPPADHTRRSRLHSSISSAM